MLRTREPVTTTVLRCRAALGSGARPVLRGPRSGILLSSIQWICTSTSSGDGPVSAAPRLQSHRCAARQLLHCTAVQCRAAWHVQYVRLQPYAARAGAARVQRGACLARRARRAQTLPLGWSSLSSRRLDRLRRCTCAATHPGPCLIFGLRVGKACAAGPDACHPTFTDS